MSPRALKDRCRPEPRFVVQNRRQDDHHGQKLGGTAAIIPSKVGFRTGGRRITLTATRNPGVHLGVQVEGGRLSGATKWRLTRLLEWHTAEECGKGTRPVSRQPHYLKRAWNFEVEGCGRGCVYGKKSGRSEKKIQLTWISWGGGPS